TLSPAEAMSVTCWVLTDLAGQHDKWFLNRLAGGAADCGFRFGLSAGKPSFAVPLTNWSHHLVAPEPLPTGRWVHLAGTFDGQTIRLYVDGVEQASTARVGPLKPSSRPLWLGSYEAGHRAHFTGLLDEVKLYDRALGAAEVRAQYEALAAQAATAGR
ncbi:MAG: LamG domain-containing protein, partial [Armatimonadetes bacterium]|nr:LamG domain-containing protein [Armatimonadota bacterium]